MIGRDGTNREFLPGRYVVAINIVVVDVPIRSGVISGILPDDDIARDVNLKLVTVPTTDKEFCIRWKVAGAFLGGLRSGVEVADKRCWLIGRH